MLLTASVAVIISLPQLANQFVKMLRQGPTATFIVEQEMPFLTEELAIELATGLLADERAGERWEPVHDGRSQSPDGRTDTYLSRNTRNPNDGRILFERKSGSPARLSVRLEYDPKARTVNYCSWLNK